MTTQFILSNLILALLVVLFWLLFQQKSYFQFNRFLLLALAPLAWLLPKAPSLWPVQQTLPERIEASITAEVLNFSNPTPNETITPASAPATWSLLEVLEVVYLLGLLYFGARFLFQTYRLYRFIQKAPKNNYEHYTLVRPQVTTMPFSFFRYLVLPDSIQPDELRQQITAHELVHIRQWHSVDILLANLLKVICWFNPMAWLYRKLIEQNQEFLVDQTLLQAGIDPKSYQLNLLKVQFPTVLPLLSNSYNFSFIKKRIQMMQKQLNPRRNWSSYLLFSLAIIPLLLAFGKQNRNLANTFLDSEAEKHILVIFDRNATLQDFESIRPEIEGAGLMYAIENYSAYPNGQIRTIEVSVNKKGTAGGMVDFKPRGEEQTHQINHFFYTTDGNFSFGRLYLEHIEEYLGTPERMSIHTFGIKAPLEEVLKQAREEVKDRQKEREAYILANDYRGKASNSSTIYGTEPGKTQVSEKYIKTIKKHIQEVKDQKNINATYFLDGKKVNAAALDQKLSEVEVRKITQLIYNKELEPITEELINLQIYLKNQ